MDKESKRFYLNNNELAVLMVNSGITNIYGLSASGKLDAKDICVVLHSLYNNKLIDNYNQEAFVISEDIKNIMSNIKEAKYLMTIHSTKNEKYIMCCYFGKGISVVLRDNKLQEKLCVYIEDVEQLSNTLVSIAEENDYELKVRLASTGEEDTNIKISKDTTEENIKSFITNYINEE